MAFGPSDQIGGRHVDIMGSPDDGVERMFSRSSCKAFIKNLFGLAVPKNMLNQINEIVSMVEEVDEKEISTVGLCFGVVCM
jgi:hypothetical protein